MARTTRRPAVGVFDLGASGGKVFLALLEDDRLRLEEVCRVRNPITLLHARPPDGGRPGKRWFWSIHAQYEGLLHGLLQMAGRIDAEIAGLGIDTWGSDGTWLSRTGDLMGEVATGRDPRWIEGRTEVLRRIPAPDLFRLTGLQPDPFRLLYQLVWYRRNEPALMDGALRFLPIHSILQYYLCGEICAEYTWITGMHTGAPAADAYLPEIFHRFQLPLEKMPPIVRPGTRLGRIHPEIAGQVGIAPFEIVATATHDTASAYACMGGNPRSFLLSTGTWFLPGVIRKEPCLNDKAFQAGFSNLGAVDGVMLQKCMAGTWILQELRRLWSARDGRDISWREIASMAEKGRPFHSAIDGNHPRFYAPDNMEETILRYCSDTGQPPPPDRDTLLRAVYEGMALSVRRALFDIRAVTGDPLDEVVVAGCAVRDPLLCRWIANACGLPVRTGLTDATAAGNAIVQAMALGWIRSLEEGRNLLRLRETEHIFEPAETAPWIDFADKSARTTPPPAKPQ